MADQEIKIGQNGRLTLPAEVRRQLGLDAGGVLKLRCRGRTIELVVGGEEVASPPLSGWRDISRALLAEERNSG